MKNRLGVLFSLVWCVLFVVLPKSARATDPGNRYTDAVVLIQEAEDAEGRADYANALPKYHDALNILHDIRTASPDWKANMVEFRVNDCESHFSQLKTKLGSPPTIPVASVTTPVMTLASAEPAPAPEASTPPPPAEKTAIDDRIGQAPRRGGQTHQREQGPFGSTGLHQQADRRRTGRSQETAGSIGQFPKGTRQRQERQRPRLPVGKAKQRSHCAARCRPKEDRGGRDCGIEESAR